MVIFHSYVRLPGGKMIVGGENSPKPTLAAVFFTKDFRTPEDAMEHPSDPKKTSMPWSNGLNMFKIVQKHKKGEQTAKKHLQWLSHDAVTMFLTWRPRIVLAQVIRETSWNR